MNRYFKPRPIVGGLLAAAAGIAAIAGAGLVWAGPASHGLRAHSAPADPVVVDAHFDKLFTQILPDGTPRQRTRLKLIAHSVHTDLGSLHAQFRTSRERAHMLLLQSTVDRTGLEALRNEQVQQADRVSRRIANGLAAAAEVLTPSQRVRLAAHLEAAHNQGAGL